MPLDEGMAGPEFDADRMRLIESLGDMTYDRLGIEDLLRELLDRVRDVLEVDTAAVLLLERSSGLLVTAATSGLQVPERERRRIAVGVGFAGRVAAERAAVVLEDLNSDELAIPELRNANLQALLGVPIEASGDLLGVLHVGRRSATPFSGADIVLLQAVAQRVSLATQARLSAEERAAATALQRSLLPTQLPRISGLDLAARYIPGEGMVSGDWYDVLVLPGGVVGIVIGDVAGHGLRAAVIMGRLRSALRAYAIEHSDPAQVLHLLDVKIHHFEAGAMATALYATTQPPFDQVVLSCAGHLPPMRVDPAGRVTAADLAVDLPLGVDVGYPRHRTVLQFEPGHSLCLFTDGLVERRTPDSGSTSQLQRGLDRLAEALTPGDANHACTAAIGALVADEPPADDLAILVMRRQPAQRGQ